VQLSSCPLLLSSSSLRASCPRQIIATLDAWLTLSDDVESIEKEKRLQARTSFYNVLLVKVERDDRYVNNQSSNVERFLALSYAFSSAVSGRLSVCCHPAHNLLSPYAWGLPGFSLGGLPRTPVGVIGLGFMSLRFFLVRDGRKTSATPRTLLLACLVR